MPEFIRLQDCKPMELTLAITAPDGRRIVKHVLLLPGGGYVAVSKK